jgi:hypothetical protein
MTFNNYIMENNKYYVKSKNEMKEYNKRYYVRNKDIIEDKINRRDELRKTYWEMYKNSDLPKQKQYVNEIIVSFE